MAGESILIVDDTPVNLKLTRILLVNEGYKIMTAASGEEALELLRSYHPALVLADIQLPGIDGLELTRRIKRNEATRDITVVALTAFAMKGDEQRATDAGCDGYITKPIDTRTLGARIRGYLDRRLESTAAKAAPADATASEAPLPEAIMQALTGKRVALVALPAADSRRMCVSLERTSGIPVFFEITEPTRSEALLDCELIVVHVRPETAGSPWLAAATIPTARPVVFMGSRDHLLALDPAVQGLACEFLMDPWQPDEALVRLSLALSKERALAPRAAPLAGVAGKIRVVVVDDDPTVLALVRIALQNFGMECHIAADGPSALHIIRRQHPQAVVLDVNMPQMDGYEVLAAIRREGIPIRVLLLTARKQEGDVLRGFALGADDYVVKPFSPMELVARLRRLLTQ